MLCPDASELRITAWKSTRLAHGTPISLQMFIYIWNLLNKYLITLNTKCQITLTLNTQVMASVKEAWFSGKRRNHVTTNSPDWKPPIFINFSRWKTKHLACKYRASWEFDRVIFLVLWIKVLFWIRKTQRFFSSLCVQYKYVSECIWCLYF